MDGRNRTLSHSPPGGECHDRPREPRPSSCSPATTAVPASAPSTGQPMQDIHGRADPLEVVQPGSWPTAVRTDEQQRDSERNAVPGKDAKAVVRHVGEEGPDHEQRRNERDDEAHRKHRKVGRREH